MQERFKLLLKEKNLTATNFAALIKVNASAVSHILNGRSKPGFDVLDKIAEAFPDIDLNWLITGKGSLYLDKQKSASPAPAPAASAPTLFDELELPKLNAVRKQSPVPASASIPESVADKLKRKSEKGIKRIIIFFEDGTFENYE